MIADSIMQVVIMNREEENKRIISSTLSIVCLYCSLLIFSKKQLRLDESTIVGIEFIGNGILFIDTGCAIRCTNNSSGHT